jgi:hypothetical protein
MERRLLAGFALAPAVVPLIVVAWALFQGVHARESLVIGSIYAACTYSAAVALGIPSHRVLSRRGWTRWWHYGLTGACIGAAVFFVISATTQHQLFAFNTLLLFVVVGVVSTMMFWLIAVQRAGR